MHIYIYREREREAVQEGGREGGRERQKGRERQAGREGGSCQTFPPVGCSDLFVEIAAAVDLFHDQMHLPLDLPSPTSSFLYMCILFII